MRTVTILLLLLLVLLQVQVWRQHVLVVELRQRVEDQLRENDDMTARNAALAAEVNDLRSGLAAVEERARAELGLIRQGEEFFLVVDPDDLAPEAAERLLELQRAQADSETPDASANPADG